MLDELDVLRDPRVLDFLFFLYGGRLFFRDVLRISMMELSFKNSLWLKFVNYFYKIVLP